MDAAATAGGLVFGAASGVTLAGTASLTLPAAAEIAVEAGGTVTLSCPVAGAGDVVKTGAGTLCVTKDVLGQTGRTVVRGGVLSAVTADSNSWLGKGGLYVEAGGTYRMGAKHTLADAMPIVLDGGVFDGVGTAMEDYVGPFTLRHGARVRNFRFFLQSTPTAHIYADGGGDAGEFEATARLFVTFGQGSALRVYNRAFDVNVAADTTLTWRGGLADWVNHNEYTGSLVKTGAGTLVLASTASNNNLRGAVRADDGTLIVRSVCQFPSATLDLTGGGTVTVEDGATFARIDVGSARPVACWMFDEADALGADSGQLGLTLPLPTAGITAAQDAERGGCVYFDGKSSLSLSGAGLPAGNSPVSFCAWVKAQTAGSGVISLGANGYSTSPSESYSIGIGWLNNQINFYVYGAGDLRLNVSANHYDGTEWHHIAGTYDPDGASGAKQKVYVDGVLLGQKDPTRTPNIQGKGDALLRIGNPTDQATRYFQGWMDDLMVFDTALTAEQVKASKDQTWKTVENVLAPGTALADRSVRAMLTANQTLTAVSGGGTVTATAGSTVTLDASAQDLSAARVTGSGRIVKTGAGALTVARADTLPDVLAVDAGAVTLTTGSLAPHVKVRYTFDDAANPGKDVTGGGLDLAPSSGRWDVISDQYAGAVYFDETADGLVPTAAGAAHLENLPHGDSAFTVLVRATLDAEGAASNAGLYTYGAWAGKQANGLRMNGAGFSHFNWGADLKPGTTLANFYAAPPSWHTIIVTYDPAAKLKTFYLDGKSLGTLEQSGLNVQAKNFTVGCAVVNSSGGLMNWKGYIDELAFLDCAVTAEQAADLSAGAAWDPACANRRMTVGEKGALTVKDGRVRAGAVDAAGAVTVAGGELTLCAGTSVFTGALTGAGTLATADGAALALIGAQTFAGDVTLGEGTGLKVAVTRETKGFWTVGGTVTLPDDLDLEVTVTGGAPLGAIPLFRAGTLTGTPDGWTVTVNDGTQKAADRWHVAVEARGNDLTLRLAAVGLTLLIR